VIGVYGMTKTKSVSQEGCPEEKWLVVEGKDRPNPGPGVDEPQKRAKPDYSFSKTA
jgi:hypothetical protein